MKTKEVIALFKQARREKGWSQEFTAEQCGLSERTIREMERGNTIPKLDTFERACESVGLVLSISPKIFQMERGELQWAA